MLHQAYSFALGFQAELVQLLLTKYCSKEQAVVLDPFCGTGTTLLEAKLRGHAAVGVDANPICVTVSRAKTNWNVGPDSLHAATNIVLDAACSRYGTYLARADVRQGPQRYRDDYLFKRTKIGQYLRSSGLMSRGWIESRPAVKALLLSQEISKLRGGQRDFLLLCLFGLLVPEISNMAYGPEIYRARARRDRNVFALFLRRATENIDRLEQVRAQQLGAPKSIVRLGDSMDAGLGFLKEASVDIAVTSPPYLSDHDYTRLTRLELVFSGSVTSLNDLQRVKRRMLRSSSKNVYLDDCWSSKVLRFPEIQKIIEEIKERAAKHTSGFARVYPRLIGEYFGGLYCHFRALSRILRRGAIAAYIVGDQSSFFATRIPTAHLLARVAEGCGAGLQVEEMVPLKEYRGTRGEVSWRNREWLVVIKKNVRRRPI